MLSEKLSKMKLEIILLATLALFSTVGTFPSIVMVHVNSDTLARRTCPDLECGIVGELFRGDWVIVLEEQGEWARITIPLLRAGMA